MLAFTNVKGFPTLIAQYSVGNPAARFYLDIYFGFVTEKKN